MCLLYSTCCVVTRSVGSINGGEKKNYTGLRTGHDWGREKRRNSTREISRRESLISWAVGEGWEKENSCSSGTAGG